VDIRLIFMGIYQRISALKHNYVFFINYLHAFISNTECDHKKAVVMKD